MKLASATGNANYRLMVLSRCCLAIFGGYLISSQSVALISLLAPDSSMALATYSALMLSFLLWLAVIMAVFSASSLKKTSVVVAVTVIVMQLIILALQWWRL